MDFSNIELSILIPAFLAGVLVLVTHIPLGRQVLDRGIIFIDLAVAQIAGLGVIAAETFFHLHEGWEVQVCAVVAALVGVLLLFAIEKQSSKHLEAMIGVVFVLAATGGILMLHNNPHGGEHLKELLAGQILWVTQSQLIQAAIWTALLLPLWFAINKWSTHLGFYIVFALAVTVSVQLVGVYLVFASLIVPALAVKDVPGMRGSVLAFGVATLAYAMGLILSALWDWPTSPLIVWCLALLAVVMVVVVQLNNKGDVTA